MSLRLRTLIFVVLSLVGLSFALGATATHVLRSSYQDVENQNLQETAERVRGTIKDELEKIETTAKAWAFWDDAFRFVQGHAPNFLQINAVDSALSPAEMNVIIYTSLEGKILFATGYDVKHSRKTSLPPGMLQHLKASDRLWRHTSLRSRVKGILMLPEAPLLMVSCPVSRTSGAGEIGGALILGRLLRQSEIGRFSAGLKLPLQMIPFNSQQLPNGFKAARQWLSTHQNTFIVPQSDQLISGYIRLNDVYEKPALLTRFDMNRDVFQQGQLAVRSLIGSLLALTFLFSGLILILLETSVLSRLSRLSQDVSAIDPTQAHLQRVRVSGRDELSQLMTHINHLLAAIEDSQQNLRRSEERFRLVAQATNEAIYDWQMEAGRIWWSDSVRNVFGHVYENGFSDLETWEQLLHPDDAARIQASLQRTLQSSETAWLEEYRFRRADGTFAYVVERGYIVRDDKQQPVRMIGSVRDISPRKMWELQLQQLNEELEDKVQSRTAELEALNEQLHVELQERQQAELAAHQAKEEAEKASLVKSEFLSRMSHELRTPMNAVLGFGQLLQMQELQARQKNAVQHIMQAGQHLLQLINEVLDIARVEQGQMHLQNERVSVQLLAHECFDLVQPLAAQRGITLSMVEDECLHCHVYADHQRVRQVLINLLSNAIKYNQPQGSVTLSCSPLPEQWLRIAVKDTGKGIAPEHIDKLFNEFERLDMSNSDIEGTGLGLALCKRLADLMGARIGVHSEVGVGSTFYVDLPLAEPAVA
jgi:PAS domain S-box-containing protein